LRKVHLNFFLDEIEAFVRKDLEGSGIRVEVVRGFEGSIRLDENKIKRVIFNLVRNAAQAMPAGGRLTLSSQLEEAGSAGGRAEAEGRSIKTEEAGSAGGRAEAEGRSIQVQGHWVFRCADTGHGIPPEIASRVFEEFVTHGKAGGTGLGLALSKRIVEEHGGTIGFESDPGKGTTFTVRLPLQGSP
jgi:signal transduction histidine kinase